MWQKFDHRPDKQTGLYEVFKAVSTPDLTSGPARYPCENDQDEAALSKVFRALAQVECAQEATNIIALEAQHGARRSTVRACLGHTPLAAIAHAVMQPTAGGSVAHQVAMAGRQMAGWNAIGGHQE